jgi:hypothetical protein
MKVNVLLKPSSVGKLKLAQLNQKNIFFEYMSIKF